MKILITGAAGDIGTRLVEFFSNQKNVELFTTDLSKPKTGCCSFGIHCIVAGQYVPWRCP